jgi:hypothetical protein
VAGIHLPLHFAACRVHCDGTIQACDLMQTLAVTRNAAVQLEEKARHLASVMSNLLSICNPTTWCAIDKPDWSFTLLQSRQQDQINVDSMNNCRLFAICNMKNLALGASVEHEIEPRFSRRGTMLFLWECAQMSVLLEELPALLCINLSRRIRTVLERSTLTASNASSRPRPRSHSPPRINIVHLHDDHSSQVAAPEPVQPNNVHLHAIWTPGIRRPFRTVAAYILAHGGAQETSKEER